MRDLRVDLRLGQSGPESGHSEAGTTADSNTADERGQARFRQALKRGPPDTEAGSEVTASAIPLNRSPFDLFGPSGRTIPPEPPSLPTATPGAGMPPTSGSIIGAVAERILVSADATREVRISIRADLLPGVEVRVVQDQGRWVVDFAVTDAGSRKLLQDSGRQAVRELARRLKTGVEMRVTDPFADPSSACCFNDIGDGSGREGES